jgi:hypothetical protein
LYLFVLIFKQKFTVSHIPQRKEKDCLNCGTIVQGHYCHVCGQENVVPKETFWHMVTHFFYDITHFDSKFFETVKDLLFRPGFLSKEYSNGRRASYLHPVKMYVFTSAIFFLLFFSVFKPDGAFKSNFNDPLNREQRTEEIEELKVKMKEKPGVPGLQKQMEMLMDTSKPVSVADLLPFEEDFTMISFSGSKIKSKKEYDSVQQSLPASKRDGWFKRRLVEKEIAINKKYGANPDEGVKKLGDSILHKLPYMLFISLPLFALLLKLVYIRRKQFYYADHGVFTIHLYIFSFIVLMVVFGLNKLDDLIHTRFIAVPITILILSQLFYLYKAMRNFYGQRRAKTFF